MDPNTCHFYDMKTEITQSIDDITFTARGMSLGIVGGLLASLALGGIAVCVALGAALGAAGGLMASRMSLRGPQKAFLKASVR